MGVLTDLRIAIYTQLNGDGALMLVAQGVHAKRAPQQPDSGSDGVFPYVVIDDVQQAEYSDRGHTGFEFFIRILTVDRDAGEKRAVLVQDLIYDALHRREDSLSVPGHSVLTIDRDSSLVEQPVTWDGSFTGVCEYRALITKDAAD